jgi:hypothetical protein
VALGRPKRLSRPGQQAAAASESDGSSGGQSPTTTKKKKNMKNATMEHPGEYLNHRFSELSALEVCAGETPIRM